MKKNNFAHTSVMSKASTVDPNAMKSFPPVTHMSLATPPDIDPNEVDLEKREKEQLEKFKAYANTSFAKQLKENDMDLPLHTIKRSDEKSDQGKMPNNKVLSIIVFFLVFVGIIVAVVASGGNEDDDDDDEIVDEFQARVDELVDICASVPVDAAVLCFNQTQSVGCNDNSLNFILDDISLQSCVACVCGDTQFSAVEACPADEDDDCDDIQQIDD